MSKDFLDSIEDKKEWKLMGDVTGEAHDFEKTKELEGVLLSSTPKNGETSAKYYVEKKDKTVAMVWGSAVIDAKLGVLAPGTEVKIVYLGKEKSEKSGRTYKNYSVFTRQ